MGFSIESGISAVTVFLQGILSFFSPCVLPLVPLYLSYLSGGARTVDADGTITYRRGRVMVNTLCFVVGISFAFFLLGLGFSAVGQFFQRWQRAITVAGGVLVILFGLYQLGAFGASRLLSAERRLPLRLDKLTMGPLTALVLGFTFSFAWTPCVGPALASVLLMASSAASAAAGFALIGLYTLGFVLPFLAVGLFTGALLDLFKRHQSVVRYTVKVGGALMILMGAMMLTGWMGGLTSYLARLGGAAGGGSPAQTQESAAPGGTSTPAPAETAAPEEELDLPPAPDFTLVDQDGVEHTLSGYQGQTVLLNFWATWCGPCQMEMPDLQALYEEWGENAGDLVVLGVANPSSDEHPLSQDGTVEEIRAFLEEGGYTYPTAMDPTGEVFSAYGVRSFPTTFMIDAEGNVFGYVIGSMSREVMDSIVEQTMTGERVQ